MCERTKRITQYYKTLEYDEINKLEALKKISTLHCEVKFKDVDDFSDRFLQTASVIEKNLSVFKAACDHVDTITTIIEHLYTAGNMLKFIYDNIITSSEINIIYMTFLTCEQSEIKLFLKMALINNSVLMHVDEQCTSIYSDYVFEMIVLEDSDLYALINCLKTKPFLSLKIKTIFVQISIKQKFLWFLKKYFKIFLSLDFPISVFQSMQELVALVPSFTKLSMISIWSEDIISAKKLAVTLNRDITFINAHLDFCYPMTFYRHKVSPFDMVNMRYLACRYSDRDKINPNAGTGLVYNLFYDGAWQKPVKDTYWIHNDNIYAQATNEDIMRCLQSAEEASRNWRAWSIASRIQTLLKLAHTLECNGKFLLANIVVKWTDYFNIINNQIYFNQNETLELIKIRRPKGIVSLQHNDETELFTYLTISLIMGNCVVVICNQGSCTLAPYCNMFSTSEIPPGVINLLSNKDMLNTFTYSKIPIVNIIHFCSLLKYIVVSLK